MGTRLQNTHSGRSNLDNGTYSDQLRKGTAGMNPEMELMDYIQAWMDLFKKNTVKQATYDRLITSFNALKRYEIARKPIGEITFFDIQRYINELTDNGYGLSTIKKQMRIVTAPLRQAAALRIIFSDPTVGVRLPSPERVQKENREAEAYTPEEQEQLWKIIDASAKHGYLCAGLMIETGLRAGEALALRWRDLDIQRSRLHVRSTVVNLANKKTSFVQSSPKSHSSIRTIPLTAKAISLLKQLQYDSDREWVFVNHGDRLSYEALRYQTQCLCKQAGVDYRGEHVFRHTFATNCYYRKIDVKILSKLLGHSDVQVTYNTYINLYGDAFDDMYRALNG